MKEFLMSIGINVSLAVSGFFGSLLLVGKEKKQNLRQQILSVVGGTMCANYLTPLVMDIVKFNNDSFQYSTAFVIGFGGLKVVEYFYNKWFKS